ncbi:hypothetical protein DL770_007398 [Monosporascus sp. CRB-9-2]|nr:hypothetical protein DL770_007398 [Monosporascus sp. CRB-9-2]
MGEAYDSIAGASLSHLDTAHPLCRASNPVKFIGLPAEHSSRCELRIEKLVSRLRRDKAPCSSDGPGMLAQAATQAATQAISPDHHKFIAKLHDLDRETAVLEITGSSIKPTSELSRVAAFLRRRYADGRQQIHHDARIEFYKGGKPIVTNELPKESTALSYRAVPIGDDGALRVDWTGSDLGLDRAQQENIELAARAGSTVGDIRRTIVRFLRDSNPDLAHLVKDPHQIEICAVGGLRPGALQGSNWEARRVGTWLCRYLRIRIRSHGDFFVFRGFNEEYIWHHPELGRHGYGHIRPLRQWLRDRVFALISGGVSPVKVEDDDIRLLSHGKVLRGRVRVRLGKTIEFAVPRKIEDSFVQAEAWLLPATETCTVCGDEKRVSEMPRRIAESCTHPATMCKECVGHWISSSLDTLAWDRLRCPECPQLLSFEDVRHLAPPDAFERYDALATRAAVGTVEEFKWCLNPRCGAGQIYPRGCSKAQCYECKRHLCLRHDVPWHSRETCEQYERRVRKQKKGDRASAKWIKEATKPCPGCERAIHKYTGCDHVTCKSLPAGPSRPRLTTSLGICGHEWCWVCLSPYYQDGRGLLHCKHKEDCPYFDNPPDYEGGRVFMPFPRARGPPPPQIPRHRHPPPPPPPPPPATFPAAHPNIHLRQPRAARDAGPPPFVFLNQYVGHGAVNHHRNLAYN